MNGLIGLALSGGGFRASLFHLGVMARLADEGLLKHVGVISTVSGGSIIGAFYYQRLCEALRNDRRLSDQDYRELIERLIVEFIAVVQDDMRDRVLYRAGSSRLIPKPVVQGLTSIGVGESDVDSKLELVLRKLMFKSAMMSELMEPPAHSANVKAELILNTSILENGKLLFISTNSASTLWEENERNHGIRAEDVISLPIAKAVAASACVPGLFNPIRITVRDKVVHGVDGGVLDNIGGHAILSLGQERMQILLSDASKPLCTERYEEVNSVESFFRIQDIFMDAIRELRLQDTDADLIHMRHDIPGIDSKARELAMNMRTDLNSFSEVEAYSLMYTGYCACDQEMSKLRKHDKGWQESVEKSVKDWVFMQVRPFMENPTPAYLALMGQKTKTRLPKSNLTWNRVLSFGYVLLYLALFVYIGVEQDFYKAIWYVGLIPLIIAALGGLLLLRRITKRKSKGTVAALHKL
ncbi:patatin-like phospholipase family protein [Paenibacillus roseipurpureus]|uniref:Patatin-like phospholipase family protein n=1 Tax=Paenibacillus roseopurpureus TaxID=2918901 RepID=A0AA96LTK2_9BACL|nr:patatin-like phospholipase family protein [Paenibacillus sp. MBLB1832]WNR44425.1 patatin-like phospholipase family protein [Paenibacillus sp. MBLB1832]